MNSRSSESAPLGYRRACSSQSAIARDGDDDAFACASRRMSLSLRAGTDALGATLAPGGLGVAGRSGSVEDTRATLDAVGASSGIMALGALATREGALTVGALEGAVGGAFARTPR